MFENREKTDISKLGEFRLIEHLTEKFDIQHETTALGLGDDAAAIDCGNKTQVVSTDLFIENIDFDIMYSPLMHVGYKCITASISDICAMNAKPAQVGVVLTHKQLANQNCV